MATKTKTTEDATTTAAEPIVRKAFTAEHETGKVIKAVDVRSIIGNAEQSRGMGVLSGMVAIGWKAFPNDTLPKLKKGEKKELAEVPEGASVMDELVSDDPARQAAMLNLLVIHEPEGDKSIWEMADSLARMGQLANIRLRPCYDEKNEVIPESFNVVAGARRTLAKAVQYAMSNVMKLEDGTFRPCEGKEESNYAGLEPSDGIPLIEAEVVEGTDPTSELMAALAENRVRKDQSPIDDALFFRRLKTEFKLTNVQVADAVYGEEAKTKNKGQLVMQRLNLLQLTPDEQIKVHTGKLGVVKAQVLLKERADAEKAGKPGAAVETPKGTPGQGERGKMPSMAQALELCNALKPDELSEEVKARFGVPKIFALSRDPNVRKFIALCCKTDILTVEKLVEAKGSEAAAAAAADAAKEAEKAAKIAEKEAAKEAKKAEKDAAKTAAAA